MTIKQTAETNERPYRSSGGVSAAGHRGRGALEDHPADGRASGVGAGHDVPPINPGGAARVFDVESCGPGRSQPARGVGRDRGATGRMRTVFWEFHSVIPSEWADPWAGHIRRTHDESGLFNSAES